MNIQLMHPADQIVEIMNRLYQYGLTTTSGGNLSVKDDEGNVWISPASVDKGSLTRRDIMMIRPDGSFVGPHKPSSEYPFHLASYRKRPDFRAILHAHPPAMVAFSAVRVPPNTALLPTEADIGRIGVAEYAVPGSELLGSFVSAQFEKGLDIVMLENHGVCIGSTSLFEAFCKFEMLDMCARLQINANDLGAPRTLTAEQLAVFSAKTDVAYAAYCPGKPTLEEMDARHTLCALLRRGYDNGLFASRQGTISCRLSDGAFLITPSGKDRKYLQPEDLVRVQNGCVPNGMTPSRSVALHEEMYRQHPDVKSIIVAHPPCTMAFAVTGTHFQSRLIPESNLLLRDVVHLPYGVPLTDPAGTAARVETRHSPVALVENQCVISAGTSPLNAFDRLEVMEYSAKSMLYTTHIGNLKDIVAINDEQVKEIEKVFNLE